MPPSPRRLQGQTGLTVTLRGVLERLLIKPSLATEDSDREEDREGERLQLEEEDIEVRVRPELEEAFSLVMHQGKEFHMPKPNVFNCWRKSYEIFDKKGGFALSPTRTQSAEAKLSFVGLVVKGHSQDRGFFLAADLLLMLISLRKVQIILNFKGEFREEAIKFVGKRSNGKVNCMLLSALHSLVPPHLSL